MGKSFEVPETDQEREAAIWNSVEFTWNADDTMNTIVYKNRDGNTLFTLTFSYTAGNAVKIIRS